MAIQTGDTAPEFVLPDQSGNEHRLSDHRGEWVLLYFYPKDDTPGCTKEACALRDSFPAFQKLNITVFGVSTDSVQSHGKFALKFLLPFSLLADTQKTVVTAYGVGAKALGIPLPFPSRTSFLINPEGKIARVYDSVKPAEHAEEVLRDIEVLKK